MAEAAASAKPPETPPAPPAAPPAPPANTVDPKLTAAQTIKPNAGPVPPDPNKARHIPPLLMSRFSIAEFKNTRKWICVPEGVTLSDVVKPEFWTHIAPNLTIADVVEVHCDDRSYYAEVYVRDRGRNWATVAVIKEVNFNEKLADAGADPAFKSVFKGPVRKWCVQRLADGEIISDKHETREVADVALMQHVKTLGTTVR